MKFYVSVTASDDWLCCFPVRKVAHVVERARSFGSQRPGLILKIPSDILKKNEKMRKISAQPMCRQ